MHEAGNGDLNVYDDVNPEARYDAGVPAFSKPDNIWLMANHADSGAMLQSCNAGNSGGIGYLSVDGKKICGFCATDIKTMGQHLDLDELHVQNTYIDAFGV